MATILMDSNLYEIILQEVQQHEDPRPSEVLHNLEDSGYSRSDLRRAFVKLLNEGVLVLTADRRLKTPPTPISMATAER
jgi:hypothetical protein